jgi:hypothetical protein
VIKIQRVLSSKPNLQSRGEPISFVVHPCQKISAILHGSFEQIYLRTQPVVGDKDNPRAIKAVSDLGLVHHTGVAEHEGTAMNVNY